MAASDSTRSAGSSAVVDARAIASEDHTVLFYDDEGRWKHAVGQFLAAGLMAGEHIIVIATGEHTRELGAALSGLFDLAGAIRSGQLVFRDARETLASFMVDGAVSPERFDATVGKLVREACGRNAGGGLRAFGEMVDLLCRDGAADEALRLEALWSDLLSRARARVWLLCAYATTTIHDLAPAEVTEIRRAHRHSHAPLKSRSGDGAVAPVFDFSKRARDLARANAMRDDATSFRLLAESAIDYAIFMLDTRGVILTWNTGAERIKGYTADEIIGRHFSISYLPAAIAAGKCAHMLEVAAEDGHCLDEGWRLRKDGSRFWAATVITAIRDREGALVGFAEVIRNLTERLRAEEQRIRLRQEREANRMKDAFLATVSHELRNPLNAILGWSALLTNQVTEPSAKKAAATIARNAEAQAKLIDDLLDVSRIVAGKLHIELEATDAVALVKEAVEVVRPMAEEKGLALTFECSDAKLPLFADPIRLQQVVMNLLSNAVKFTDRGFIAVRLHSERAQVRFEVSDTGRGIDPEFLPHAFERFAQSEAEREQPRGGLGLGLAIVKHLIEQHGGSVAADSPGMGLGATFSFVLPLKPPSEPQG